METRDGERRYGTRRSGTGRYPGTGENVCPRCNGGGEVDGKVCSFCEGSGTVIEGIGGG